MFRLCESARMRTGISFTVSSSDRKQLEAIIASGNSAQKHVWRALIVLLSGDGVGTQGIMNATGKSKTTVWRWQARFSEAGVAGLLSDATRPPGKAPTPQERVDEVVRKTQESPPHEAMHWTARAMAKTMGLGVVTVQRIWKAHGLSPHRWRQFKLSNDPAFAEKLRDVVGLYVSPPAHAVVLSVDEKSQIQALDRTQPGLPLKKGRGQTMTHDYKRNGTTTLFAAIELGQRDVIATSMERHRHQEWLMFLRRIDEQTPKDLDLHLIVDNYATHKHEKVQRWLKRHPRFHMHFIPTSSSWLNIIEGFFRNLDQKRLKRGVFQNVPGLIQSIMDYIEGHNRDPRPIVWTAAADSILEKVGRARAKLDKSATA